MWSILPDAWGKMDLVGVKWTFAISQKTVQFLPFKRHRTYNYTNYNYDISSKPIDSLKDILKVSRFDRDNNHILVRTIPEHVSMREENAQYVTFTNMIGHYFF